VRPVCGAIVCQGLTYPPSSTHVECRFQSGNFHLELVHQVTTKLISVGRRDRLGRSRIVVSIMPAAHTNPRHDITDRHWAPAAAG